MPRELAQIMREAFPRLSDIAQQVGGKELETLRTVVMK